MKFVVLALVLLLGGCLEAADLAQERLQTPAYCATESGGVAICPGAAGPTPGY